MARKISKARQKQIIRASRKAASRAGANDKASIGKLRVQTVALWKRLVIGGFGLLFLGLAIYFQSRSLGAAVFFSICALVTILFGAFGKRKSIDDALKGLDASITDQILSSILNNLF